MIFAGDNFYPLQWDRLVRDIVFSDHCHQFPVERALETLFHKKPIDLLTGFYRLYYRSDSKNKVTFF